MSASLDHAESLLRDPCTPFLARDAAPPEWVLAACSRNSDGTANFERQTAMIATWRLAYDLANAAIRSGDLRRHDWPDTLQLLVHTRCAARLGVSLADFAAARRKMR